MRHRRGLAVVGAALLCLGAGGLAAGYFAPRHRLLERASDRFMAAHDWFWPIVGIAAWGVALSCGVWLTAQVRAAVARRVALVDGTARMLMRAASRGLAGDVRGLPGVTEVQVRFTGPAEGPVVRLHVICDESADLGVLRLRIADGPLARFRHLVDMPELPAVIRFRVAYRRQCVA